MGMLNYKDKARKHSSRVYFEKLTASQGPLGEKNTQAKQKTEQKT